MAVAVTSLGVQFDTNAGSKTVTATPSVSDYIVVVAAGSGTPRPKSFTITVSDNNSDGQGTYTQAVASNGTNLWSCSIWVRSQPIGSASSTVFTATRSGDSGGGLQVFAVSGITKTGIGAQRQVTKNFDASSTTPSMVFANAALTTNPVIACIVNDSAAPILTEPTGFTEQNDSGYSTPTISLETVSKDSGFTSTTITWGSASGTAWEGLALEIDASSVPILNNPTVFNLPYRTPDDPNLVFTGYLYTPNSTNWKGLTFPGIVCTRAGQYSAGGPNESNSMLQYLSGDTSGGFVGQGYLCLYADVRLLKSSGPGLSGQTTTGNYPQPIYDLLRAVAYLRNHPKCNGFVAAIGGSGSADLVAQSLLIGRPGIDRPDCAVSMSAPFDAGNTDSDVSGQITSILNNYYNETNTTILTSESCASKVYGNMPPLYFANGQNEEMPYSMATHMQTNLDNAGVRNYTFHTNTANGGIQHSFGTFTENQNAIVAFLNKCSAQTGGTSESAPMGGGQPSFNQRMNARGISIAGAQSFVPVIPGKARGRMAELKAKASLTPDEEEELDALTGIYD